MTAPALQASMLAVAVAGPWLRAVLAAAFAMLALAFLGEAQGQTLCSMPVQPLCSTDITSVDTETEQQRCLDDIDRFMSNLTEYRVCLDDVLERAETIEETADAFRRCLREGRGDCVLKLER